MKTKILLWSISSALSTAIAGEPSASDQVQVIQLDADTKLTLLGVTYGRGNLRAPGFEQFGGFNPIYGANDSTVVWIQVDHEPGRWPSFELVVYDEAKTACVTTEKRSASHIKDGVEVHGFVLEAFPRWDKEVTLRARYHDRPIADGQIVITNPHPVSVAAWAPEPLPITKSDGDFEVTLMRLSAGAPVPYWQGRTPTPTNDLAQQCVRLDFDFRQKGEPATNWFPWLVWTTDAAGNHVYSALRDYPPHGIAPYPPTGARDGYFYQPGLWPDEPAWKVRLEFTRSSGFSDDEILTFTNVPVRAGSRQDADDEWTWDASKTNFTFTPGTVNGVQVKLLPPLVYPPKILPGEKHIMIVIYADPDPTLQGMRLTLLQATDDQGKDVTTPFPPAWAGHFSFDFPNPRDLKTLNLKLALHKCRFVEFMVKPPKQ